MNDSIFEDFNETKSKFRAVSKSEGKTLRNAIDVSSYGQSPFKLFSPYTYSQDFSIPVPGLEKLSAHSVESIWQGLKIIRNKIDLSLLYKKPKKRLGLVQGHQYGYEVLGCADAREKIFKPAYFFYLNNHVPQDIKRNILEKSFESVLTFYDVEESINPKDISLPLSHSTYLKMFFDNLYRSELEKAKETITMSYEKCVLPHETLAEPIARVLTYAGRGRLERKIFIEASKLMPKNVDFFTNRYYEQLNEHLIRSTVLVR